PPNVFSELHESAPSVTVTVASHTPITVVGAASVTRPFSVTLVSTGAGGVTALGAVDGAVGDSSRLQPVTAKAQTIAAMRPIDDIVVVGRTPVWSSLALITSRLCKSETGTFRTSAVKIDLLARQEVVRRWTGWKGGCRFSLVRKYGRARPMTSHLLRGVSSRDSSLCRHLLEELVGARADLVARQVLFARGDPPAVAARVGDRAGAVAPELIGHRHLHLGAGRHRAVEERVRVVDVDPEGCGRAAKRLRSLAAHHRVVDHEGRVADPQFGVHHLAVGAEAAGDFLRAERFDVPLHGLRRVVEHQLR